MYPRATVARLGMGGSAPPPPPPPPPLVVIASTDYVAAYRTDGPPGSHSVVYTGSISVSIGGGSGDYSITWSASLDAGYPVSVSGQGTTSASFGCDLPNQASTGGTWFVSATDNNTGGSGFDSGTMNAYSA